MSSAVPVRVRTVRPVGELRGAAARSRLTVVPRRSRRGAPAPRIPFVTLVTLVLVAGVVGLLLFNTSMQQASFASTKLQEQATSLGLRQQTLQLQLQQMRAPDRLGAKARALGMEVSGSPLFLDLGSGRILGDPAAAARTTPLRVDPYPAPRPPALTPDRVVGTASNSAALGAASARPGAAAGRNG